MIVFDLRCADGCAVWPGVVEELDAGAKELAEDREEEMKPLLIDQA